MEPEKLGTWRKPPLAYVVAELVISPHYSVGAAIAALQDRVRSTYPRTVEALELNLENPASAAPSQVWRLLSGDQTRGIQIGARAISFHATSYSNSEDFQTRFREVLEAVESTKLGAFVERAGLRYVDFIIPAQGLTASDYLIPGLQGLELQDGAQIESRMWAASYLVGQVRVQARTAAPAPAGMLFPPNFNALPLKKAGIMVEAEKTAAEGTQTGFIDTDCITDVNKVFDVDGLASIYQELHGMSSSTFKALISDRAEKEWK